MRSLLAIAAFVLAAQVAWAGPAAEWLPEDTAFFASVDNVARLAERARSGPLGALWSDPALAELTRRIEARFATGRPGDVTPLDLLRLVKGQVAIAGLPRADGVAFVGFVDCGPRTLPFRALLEVYHRQQARGGGVTETVVPFGGRSILVRRKGRAVQAHVWIGSVVCFSDSVAALQEIVARPARSLARLAAFREARTRDADLFVWVPPAYWFAQLGLAPAQREALGLDGVRGLAGALELEPDGVRTEIVVRTEGPRRGVLALLDAPASDLGPPPFVPADCGAVLTLRVDYRRMVREALRLRPDLGGPLLEEVTALRRAAGIDVLPLVHALGDELTVAFLPPSWSRSTGSDSIMDPRAAWGDLVLVQKVRHPGAVQRFLDQLDRAAGGLPRLEVGGVPLLFLPGETLGVLALFDRHLVVGTTADSVRALVRARTSLRDADAYARASRRVASRRTAFAILNPHGRSGPTLAWVALKAARPDLAPLLDALERYRDVGAFALSSDSDALRFTWHAGIGR